MYDENQIVHIRWNNTNEDWYKSKGYKFTGRNNYFDVYAKDLSPHSSAKINVTCDYCGSDYQTQFALITSGRKTIKKDCCPKCTGVKASEVSHDKRAHRAIGKAKDICERFGYTLLTTTNDYRDLNMIAKFICPKHGKQSMLLDNLIHGHECLCCSYEKRGNKLKHSIDHIKSDIESINGNILLNPNDYSGVFDRNLRIKCSCGNIFITSYANYMNAGVTRCHRCSCKESSGEKIIREFFEKNNIAYEQEKRFKDCRDTKPLPFDFYIPSKCTIVEFDGQHHYKAIRGYDSLAKTQKHDKIKNEYCEKHNIRLIRIPYWEGHNINEILTKTIL